MPARRTTKLSACLVAAAAFTALNSRQAAWVAGPRAAGNFAGNTLPAAAQGRDGVQMRFFDKIQEALGMKSSPESEAAAGLKALTVGAKAEAKADLTELKAKRADARAVMKSMDEAMEALRAAKAKAMEECEVGWDSTEAEWDASLKECAAPVLESAEAAKKVLIELESTNSELKAVADRTEANAANRTQAAEALVAELEPEAQESLAKKVKEASQPISDGEGLRQWALGSADIVDLEREIAQSTGETTIEEGMFVSALREKRSARATVEKEAAAKKAAAEAAAKSAAASPTPAASSSSSSEEGGSPVGLVVVAALAAAAYAYSQGLIPGGDAPSAVATKSEPAAVVKVETPKVEMPAMPAMPEIKMPTMPSKPEVPAAPTSLPREDAVKNKKEDLEVKITKGDLLAMK